MIKYSAKVNRTSEFWSSGANEDLKCSTSVLVWCGQNRIEVRKEDVRMNWTNAISASERCLTLRLDGGRFGLQYASCGSGKFNFICEVHRWQRYITLFIIKTFSRKMQLWSVVHPTAKQTLVSC
jgi:hypothetical protein